MSSESDPSAPVELKAHLRVERPARDDGYRPISDPLWVWASILAFPGSVESRLVLTAARRLDVGHRQIERARDRITALPQSENPASRQEVHEIVGDVEMGIWSIDKAIEIALSLSGRYRVEVPVPGIVTEKQPLVARLRDHYAHIDERALGKVKGKPDVTAADAFEFAAILRDRTLTDEHDTLGIDDEITELCIATRDYLVKTWQELVSRAHKAVSASS